MTTLNEHEAFEMEALEFLSSKRLLGPLVFTGGTMLRLCHELPRYSLDMDFWFAKETDVDGYLHRLCDAFEGKYSITDAQNKFHSLLVELQKEKRRPKLKIEIRKEITHPGGMEEKIAYSRNYATQVLVKASTLKQMLKNKVDALLDRSEIRDAFDLEFLLRKGTDADLSKETKHKILHRLKTFKKKDFDVKLGSILLPDLRKYYRQNRFKWLEEKLSFEEWKTESS
jgi:hypothetical protein